MQARYTFSGHVHLASAFEPRRYAAHLMGAGELRGHKLTVAPPVLADAAPLFDGKTCFLNHASLFEHPRLENAVGVIQDVYLDPTGLAGTLVLKDTPAAQLAERLIAQALADDANGEPSIDLGLSADCWILTSDKPDDSGRHVVTRIMEVSSVDLVFRPASDNARIDRVLAHALPTTPMDTQTNPTPTPTGPEEYLIALSEATLAARLAASGLPQPSQDHIRTQLAGTAASVQQIDQAITTQRDLLAQLHASQVITGFDRPSDGGRRVSMTTGSDQFQAYVDWMFGVSGAQLPPPSMRRPADLYFALSGDYDWHGRFAAERVLLANANSTTLADMATNAMNKVILEQWASLQAYRWFEPLVRVQPNDGSTQDMAWISFGGIANLPSVTEGGSYTELSVADAKEADSFTKYGGYVGITEEMFRKSELARIQAVPRALAVAAVRTRSNAIATIFTTASGTGPTLDDDSTVLFHSNHSNIATTAFSTAAWAAARIECFKQTELGSSKRTGVMPRFLLVPVDLYDSALVTFGYGGGPGGYPGTANNDTNPYQNSRPGDPRPEIVVVPEWTDTSDWAYLVDPNLWPVLQMSYVQAPGGGSHPTPEIFSVATPTAGLMFTNDVLPVRVRDWFAYGVSTYRGIGKRNVT